MSDEKRLPDYSEWLSLERLQAEDIQWTDPTLRTWPTFVEWIWKVRQFAPMESIIEFGCGTGLIPAHLPIIIGYVGVDSNPYCIAAAFARNQHCRTFYCLDVRTAELPKPPKRLACAFSFLKHFGLHEWDDILARVLSHGSWGLFSIPLGEQTLDDGVEYPHVWVDRARLESAVDAAGHVIVEIAPLPGGESMVVTQRK